MVESTGIAEGAIGMAAQDAPTRHDEEGTDDRALRDGEGFVRNDEDKTNGSRLSLRYAFVCAGNGISYAVRTQRNMKIHLAVSVLALVLGLVLSIDAASWTAVVICIALVFAAECLNTALESVVDLVAPEYHELARRTKDCAAGAVLILACCSLVVAGIVFVPRIMALLAG